MECFVVTELLDLEETVAIKLIVFLSVAELALDVLRVVLQSSDAPIESATTAWDAEFDLTLEDIGVVLTNDWLLLECDLTVDANAVLTVKVAVDVECDLTVDITDPWEETVAVAVADDRDLTVDETATGTLFTVNVGVAVDDDTDLDCDVTQVPPDSVALLP